MWFGIITLVTALAIAGVAAWFSIAGLMAIFSAAALPIAIMAGTLEIGKLLTASWLYRYWNETSLALKSYLSTAVVILMVITSMGIFGYLSKAHLDQASLSGDAFAIVERIDGQIAREENKIEIIQDRINSLGSGGLDVSDSISQQEEIRDGAWTRVQGDIDYAQGQIEEIRSQLKTDIDSQNNRLTELDKSVNELRSKGVETVTVDEGVFSNEVQVIDYVAQANQLLESQKPERDQIREQIKEIREIANSEIQKQQSTIDSYRSQAQKTIDDANTEINRLRELSTGKQDDALAKIDDFNNEIDGIYNKIATLKDEKFEAQGTVRELEKEVGPIKYVAQLLFGGDGEELLDKAVQVFILMLVFVFDPLAVMLVIAANQTLLRYGINLEKAGPDTPPRGPEDDPNKYWDSDFEEQSRRLYGDNMPDLPSAVEDAAKAMMESAAKDKDKEIAKLKKQLKKKPKEVIKEVEVEKIVEVEKKEDLEFKVPPAIAKLEKRLKEKLDGK